MYNIIINVRYRRCLSTLLEVLLFILFPLYSLPIVWLGILRRKGMSIFLLCIFMGLFAYLFPPIGDIYRYKLLYYQYQYLTFEDFCLWELSFKFDFVFYILIWVFAKLGLPYELLNFVFAFTAYRVVFKMFNYLTQWNQNLHDHKNYVYALIIFFCCINPFLFLYRFGVALIFFLYGFYLLYCKGNKIGVVYLLLSILTHISYLILVLFVIISYVWHLKRRDRFWIGLGIGFLIIGLPTTGILLWLLSCLPLSELITVKLDEYISGYWAGDFLKDNSFLFYLSRVFSFVMFYPFIYHFFKTFAVPCRIASFLLLLFLFICLLQESFVMNERYAKIFIVVYLVYLLKNANVCFARKYLTQLLLMGAIFMFSMNCYSYWRAFFIGNEYKLLFTPAPALFSNTYSEEWLVKNIDEEGAMIKYKEY